MTSVTTPAWLAVIARTTQLLGCAACIAFGGCKRQVAPPVEEVWDEQPTTDKAEALGNLAPPWPAPTRAMLDNGLLTVWLQEDQTPAHHFRLILPTIRDGQAMSAGAVAVAGEFLRFELHRRLSKGGGAIHIEHQPGRLEVAIHGRQPAADRITAWLGTTLGRQDPKLGLAAAQERLASRVASPQAVDLATSVLVSQLLSQPPDSQRLDGPGVVALSRESLMRAWTELTDPRHAVLIVHSGLPAAEHRSQLRRLASAWRGRGRQQIEPSATGRLRPWKPLESTNTRLLADPKAPMRVVQGATSNDPVLVLGRLLPAKTAADRSLARLAQRLVQEKMDARLAIAGTYALFIVSVPLSSRSPQESVENAIAKLTQLAGIRHQTQRLFQAAQLWLGARVVEASLGGEDWTALWSESFDLANDDSEVGTALARDAKAMLTPEPDALQAWQQQWLDPNGGEAGWQWVIAGADSRTLRKLSRFGPTASTP